MLPSSVRRVVNSSGQQAGLASSIASSASKAAAASSPVFLRGHQRRFSSSKPSKSDNGSSDISTGAGQSVPASSTARADGKASGDKRRRKNKEASGKDASFKKLPSVPSTHHMSHEGRLIFRETRFGAAYANHGNLALGLSSFFSLHRPISISQTMPRTVSDEHFASIFAARSKANRVSDTMSTLSDTIDQLEGPMAQMTIGGQGDSSVREELQQRLDMRNLDGSEPSVHLQVDTMSGDFLPFRPPPLPTTQAAGESEAMTAQGEETEETPMHRVYKAMFTIEESAEPSGQVRIVAHSPQIVEDQQPRSFIERLAQRQLRLNESRGRRDMYAISVKRQRRLKMKKKKYKKLMRRTRNLRRKLDRT